MPTEPSQQALLAWICVLCLTAADAALVALLIRLPRRLDASGAGSLTLNQALDRNHLGLPKAKTSGTLWWLLAGCGAMFLCWGLLSRSALDARSLFCAINALILFVSVLVFGRRIRKLHERAAASRAAIEESVNESGLLLFSWQLLTFFGFRGDVDGMPLIKGAAAGLLLLLMAHARVKRFRILCGFLAFMMLGLAIISAYPFESVRPATLSAALRWQAGLTVLGSLAAILLLLRRAPHAAGPRTSSARRRRPAVHA